MKHATVIIAILACSLLIYGFITQWRFVTYTNHSQGFRINYPAGWRVTQTEMSTSFSSPATLQAFEANRKKAQPITEGLCSEDLYIVVQSSENFSEVHNGKNFIEWGRSLSKEDTGLYKSKETRLGGEVAFEGTPLGEGLYYGTDVEHNGHVYDILECGSRTNIDSFSPTIQRMLQTLSWLQ